MRKFQVLLPDHISNRWSPGEIGEEMPMPVDMVGDYFVCLRFPGTVQVELFGRKTEMSRVFYFYEGEVQEVIVK
jgi:hypothetical protein